MGSHGKGSKTNKVDCVLHDLVFWFAPRLDLQVIRREHSYHESRLLRISVSAQLATGKGCRYDQFGLYWRCCEAFGGTFSYSSTSFGHNLVGFGICLQIGLREASNGFG
jgi:hypothetical protein